MAEPDGSTSPTVIEPRGAPAAARPRPTDTAPTGGEIGAPEGVAWYSRDGALQGADRHFFDLLGVAASDAAVRRLDALLDFLRPRLRGGSLGRVLELPAQTHAKIEVAGRLLELYLRPLAGTNGHDGGGIALSLRDRTEHQRLQERAHQAQKMEAIGRLVGGISHDFNNLLTVIRGYCDYSREQLESLESSALLGQKAPCAALRASLDEIAKASSHASRLTRQLLAYSRQQVVSPEPIDLNDELDEIEKMLDRLLGQDFTLALEPRLRPATVKADRGQMHQMLMNLVINARDAMPSGGQITLRTEAFTVDEAFAGQFDYPVELGEKVMLTVLDNGNGIDPEVLPRIFEPFFTTKELGRGTGLGLSTVYGIVKQSGGYIWVDSTPGVGSEFRICLPLEEGDPHRQRAAVSRPAPARGRRILLVDDDEHVRRVITHLLTHAGHTVQDVPPEAALAALEGGERFDLAITDLVMCEIDGAELAARLGAVQPDLPVLFVSGYDPDAYGRRGVLPEGAAFLPKPLDDETLRAKIAEILDA